MRFLTHIVTLLLPFFIITPTLSANVDMQTEEVQLLLDDYNTLNPLEESDPVEVAHTRAQGYITPAVFYGPVSIMADDNVSLAVNGQASFDNVAANTITADALILPYLSDDAGQYLYLDSNGIVSAHTVSPGTGTVTFVNAGTGISVTGNAAINPTINLATPVTVSTGGTGVTTFIPNSLILSGATATSALTTLSLINGQLAIGSAGSAPIAANLTPGSGIAIANGAGSITVSTIGSVPSSFITNSGNAVPSANNLSILGSPSKGISSSGTGSTVTLSLTTPVAVTNGGTGTTSYGTNGIVISGATATSALAALSLANGQIAIGSAGNAPIAANLTPGSGIAIANGAGSITVSTSSNVPTSFTANSGSAVPSANNLNILGSPSKGISSSGTGSTVTLSLTTPVAVTNGGTGATSYGTNGAVISGTSTTSALSAVPLPDGQILIGSSTQPPAAGTLTQGTGIAITSASHSITVAVAPTVATSFNEDTGTAIPVNNVLTIHGSPTQGIATTGAGATIAIAGINATTTQKGVASFNATNFSVTSAAVASNDFTISAGNGLTGGGSLTLGGTTTIAIAPPVSVANGGTGATSFTANGIVLSGATTTTALASQALTNGQLLIGSTSAAPAAAALTQGTGITITNGAGSIAIANSGVTSITGDTGSPLTGALTVTAPNNSAGSTITFQGSGSTMSLALTDSYQNTLIGANAGGTMGGSLGAGNSTALGYNAMSAATIDCPFNTAIGSEALGSIASGSAYNVALGLDTLLNTSGAYNIAVGSYAGTSLRTGSNNIYIGCDAGGANGSSSITESNTIRLGNSNPAFTGAGSPQIACFIAGINGATSASGVEVFCDASGQLGTASSSRRYKDNIAPIPATSDKLMQLEAVQFTYKNDGKKRKQYGLIAEDVYKTYPELIAYNNAGEIQTIRYNQLHALLLKGWQEQQKEIASLRHQLETTYKEQQQKISDLYEKINVPEPIIAAAQESTGSAWNIFSLFKDAEDIKLDNAQ